MKTLHALFNSTFEGGNARGFNAHAAFAGFSRDLIDRQGIVIERAGEMARALRT